MMPALIIRQAGPSMTLQDLGRPGHMAFGVSTGGAADRLAMFEGGALLGQGASCAAIEMAGIGGMFEVQRDITIALTGAPKRARLDGVDLLWNASHPISAGQTLSIAGAPKGVYGYLHILGGFAAVPFLGSRGAHLAAGIGTALKEGDKLSLQTRPASQGPAQKLSPPDRCSGGVVRVLPSVHTPFFAAETIDRFSATTFARGPRGNRQGVEMTSDQKPFALNDQLTILSEPIMAGDIQMTGDGQPYVLLSECQTTGGYPRIAMVHPEDLPIVAQAQTGTPIEFQFVDHATAFASCRSNDQIIADLKRQLQPLVRDPRDIPDLLSYQLISGATTGRDG